MTKLDHYFAITDSVIHFWAFKMIPNPYDTAPLRRSFLLFRAISTKIKLPKNYLYQGNIFNTKKNQLLIL